MATSQALLISLTNLLFNGEAGADVALSFEAVVNAAGRVSAQKDFGAAVSGSGRPMLFNWSGEVLGQATPTQYGTVDLYLATAPDHDPTQISGDIGSADAALGDLDQLRNLKYIGALVFEEGDTTKMVGDGEVTITKRYGSIVAVNNSGATINATDSSFRFDLTPVAIQGQAT